MNEDSVVGRDIKEIVSLPEWQSIRQSFIGRWKTDPFGNLLKLKEFAGDLKTLSNRRLRIVQNYVTGSGFRIGIISSPDILRFTQEVKDEVSARKTDGRWK